MKMAAPITDINQTPLERIKKNIRFSYDYFKNNYDRYNEFIRFVFETSLKEEDVTLLVNLGKPQLEFNILEAYISRLLGEFSKQEPDIAVNADDQNAADPKVISLLEAHLRHELNDSKNEHTRYLVYKDLLAGGFSVFKIYTEYANPMSFDQTIRIARASDPTLCCFDQLARLPHKGDGRFCAELFPMSKDDFLEEYPDADISSINFRRDFAGFNWSYLNDSTPIIIVCDYYEKKKKKVKIVKLANGQVVRYDKYKEELKKYDGFLPPPGIVGKPRMTELETIVRYRLIENQVLEYKETDYSHLPLVFVDGNSVLVKTPKNGNVHQVTRPYVYHAKGAQRLKNFAGVTLANGIENIVQHKFKVSKEALPKETEFLEPYKDIQHASLLVYNQFWEQNPQVALQPPQEIQNVPLPAEVVQGFSGTDQLIQNILGSYDAQLGINNNQLSGVAVVEAATQSNAAAMPYIVGFMHGLQRIAEIYVDLFPKYYKTPRTIPIRDEKGKRTFIPINQENGINMFYDANALNVVVKAGASFTVQKNRTLMMVQQLSQMSPLFAEMMASKGLSFILDNMEGRGIEQLKQMAEQWVQEYQQQKQMQMQMQQQQMQMNPQLLKAQSEQQKIQANMQIKQQELATKQFQANTERDSTLMKSEAEKMRAIADIMMANEDHNLRRDEHDLKRIQVAHEHAKNIATHHKKGNNKED
jgi:hypothetical protein